MTSTDKRPGQRISWAQFYTLTDTQPPVGFIADRTRKAANNNQCKYERTAETREMGRAYVENRNAHDAAAIADHREFIKKRFSGLSPQPSTPTRIEHAIAKHSVNLARQFVRLRELVRPALVAANDNLADPNIAERERDWGLERGHNQGSIRPSIPEMLRAYEAGLPHGIHYHEKREPAHTWIGGRINGKFTGLFIGHGEHAPLYYGDTKGRKKQAKYEGGQLTRNLAPDKKREREVHLARLSEYMSLNGGPALRGNLDICFRIKGRRYAYFTPGVAHYRNNDYGRLCISAMKGAGENKTRAPRMQELAELDRADDAADLLSKLDVETRTVIDTMLVADTFGEVAAALGKKPTAHKGKRLVLTALETFSEKIAA